MMLTFTSWFKELRNIKRKNDSKIRFLLQPIVLDLTHNKFMSGDNKIFNSKEKRDKYVNSDEYKSYLDDLFNDYCIECEKNREKTFKLQ